MKKWMLAASLLLVPAALLTACSGGGNSATEPAPQEKKPAEPITLYVYDGVYTKADFEAIYPAALKEKFPNVTLQRIEKMTANVHIDVEQMVVSGQELDIILAPNFHYQLLNQIGIIEDITARVKSNSAELAKLNKDVNDNLTKVGNGKIVMLPLFRNIQATFYNKGIFDKLGVSYPKDGMTYDDAIELAKKMTRTLDGIKYYGFFPGNPAIQLGQLSQTFLDGKTDEPLLLSDSFTKVLNLHKSVFEVPGNDFVDVAKGRDNFFKVQNTAMIVDGMGYMNQQNMDTIDWDMVTIPSFKDKPNVHAKLDFFASYVSLKSKHKEAAVDVITAMATNEKIQGLIAESARIPVIDNADVLKKYGSKKMQGKNTSVLQKTISAPLPATSNYENQWNLTGAPFMAQAYTPVMQGKIDANTGLRAAQEAVQQLMKAEKAKAK
ncbi:MAG: family 1 extracellular solute-binding protein [Paenibacillus sp.]|nr:family 1 extracellular solute-binding protein [Paenibacillus sp.]